MLEAIPQRKLQPVVGGCVAGGERVECRVEGVDAQRWSGHRSEPIRVVRQEHGRAADLSAGRILIGESMLAPVLVQEIEEVENIQPDLNVLVADR